MLSLSSRGEEKKGVGVSWGRRMLVRGEVGCGWLVGLRMPFRYSDVVVGANVTVFVQDMVTR